MSLFILICVQLGSRTSFLQVSSQTGEDSTGRDVQTDNIVMVNRWVQWPPEDRRGWGCDDDDDDDVMNSGHITNTILSDKDAMGLSKFLHSASQVRQSTVKFIYLLQ